MEIKELLRRADAQGVDDREIAEITGRNPSTIWRWRKKPPKAFVYDEGLRRLIEKLSRGDGMKAERGGEKSKTVAAGSERADRKQRRRRK